MSAAVQRELERRIDEWYAQVRSRPELLISSRRSDLTGLEEYRRIVRLGRPALAYLMDDIAAGEIMLLPAALEIARLRTADIVPDPSDFYSDQELAQYLLRWWQPRRRIPWFLLPIVNLFWR